MLTAIEEHFEGQVGPPAVSTGMHLMLRLPCVSRLAPVDLENEIVLRAGARGVGVYPVGPCCARPPASPGLLLGFAALSAEQIQEGIRRLAEIVRECGIGGRLRRGNEPN